MNVTRARFLVWLCVLPLFALASCLGVKPQSGGGGSMTLGGSSGPTVVTTNAPENPRTPTATTAEKTTTREYAPAPPQTTLAAPPAALSNVAPSGPAAPAAAAPPNQPTLLREVVVERVTTQLGSSWEDKARELGVKLANMRGVMWVGVALLIIGPVIGWRMGWMTNGLIAGAVGLLLIILAQVVPGNEAWFGLGGLLLIPLVAYAWYHGHHTATAAFNTVAASGKTSQ